MITAGQDTIQVKSIQMVIMASGAEVLPHIEITVTDHTREIYSDATKRKIWAQWIDACLEDKNNPSSPTGRMRPLKVEIFGGDDNTKPYRTFEIKSAFPLQYTESASGGQHSYTITFARGPRRGSDAPVVLTAH